MTGRGVEREITSVTLSDGSVLPASKLVCPECQSFDLDVDMQRTTTPFGGWLATCLHGHQWVLAPHGRDGWAVLKDMGGGIFAGSDG